MEIEAEIEKFLQATKKKSDAGSTLSPSLSPLHLLFIQTSLQRMKKREEKEAILKSTVEFRYDYIFGHLQKYCYSENIVIAKCII